jgi:guanylate kinase
MESENGKLLIFCGPSGSGKTTVVKHLVELMPSIEFSVSATTRDQRKDEVNGRDYHFISNSTFKNKIGNHEFVEWEEVYPGTFYGTLHAELNRIWKDGKCVIFDIDVIGGLNIKEQFGERAMSVIIMPPSLDVLENRLRNRSTENDDSITRRLAKASYEMSFVNRFDRVIVNNNLDDTLTMASDIAHEFLGLSVS